jgi:UDP-N-acetylmuramoyl-tripeptide--D-alanyl-D-alanine ligase
MPGGPALLPVDCPYCERLRTRARQLGVTHIFTFGSAACADGRLTHYEETAEGVRIGAQILGKPVDALVGAPGKHIAANALAALTTVGIAGGDVVAAAAALKSFSALKGRGERIRAQGVEIIDESYNANPASMAAALALLAKAPGRKIAVLGDMLEMGAEGPALHAGLAQYLAAADLVFLCGPLMRSLHDALPADRRHGYAANSKELAAHVVAAVKTGDTVLVKGSNGSRMGVVIEAIKARSGG